MTTRLRRICDGDEGVGVILIIGVSVLVFALAATAIAYAVNGISQSRQRTAYELSLATAEAGIDLSLARLQRAFDYYNQDYPIPMNSSSPVEPTPWCTIGEINWPASGDGANGVFSSEASEEAWAAGHLATISAEPSCVQHTEKGEVAVLKPVSPTVGGLYPKAGKVYALAAVPGFDDPNAKTRLLKSEYLFMPYRPTHAVLAAGTLTLESSTKVTAAYGVDPALASVHTNGSLSGGGNPTVTGPVTSTESSPVTSTNFNPVYNPDGLVQHEATKRIPDISAQKLYFQAPAKTDLSTWYDLCEDGTVREWSSSGPCTAASSLGTAEAGLTFRGWAFDSSARLWTATRDAMDGTYYIHRANVDVGPGNDGNTASGMGFLKFTVIAEAENAEDCGTKRYGNISWNRFTLKAPSYPNIWFYADGDLQTGSQFTAGSGISGNPVISGMFIAGDQMELTTSSQGAVGSVLVGNECVTPPSPSVGNQGLITSTVIKNPTIYYDPNSDAPFTSIITTSLWLDYSG